MSLLRRIESARPAGDVNGSGMGLMGRKSLDAGEGLFLPGTNSIHMKR